MGGGVIIFFQLSSESSSSSKTMTPSGGDSGVHGSFGVSAASSSAPRSTSSFSVCIAVFGRARRSPAGASGSRSERSTSSLKAVIAVFGRSRRPPSEAPASEGWLRVAGAVPASASATSSLVSPRSTSALSTAIAVLGRAMRSPGGRDSDLGESMSTSSLSVTMAVLGRERRSGEHDSPRGASRESSSISSFSVTMAVLGRARRSGVSSRKSLSGDAPNAKHTSFQHAPAPEEAAAKSVLSSPSSSSSPVAREAMTSEPSLGTEARAWRQSAASPSAEGGDETGMEFSCESSSRSNPLTGLWGGILPGGSESGAGGSERGTGGAVGGVRCCCVEYAVWA
eukprot:Hpha_TRINITY_DN4194_c0_g1::TRINITY_DN4194_c0_g1_i1::g.194765::m.194765